MPISALNFFGLTDPHDLQGILNSLFGSYVLRTSLPKSRVNARRHTVFAQTREGLYLVQYWFKNPKTSLAQTSDPK
jgi:dihydroorotate dehydrogenase